MNIFLDLESIPCEDPATIAEIASGIKQPANYKKTETIAAWEANEKPAAVAEAVLKTAFDGTYGRVIVIGYAVDDGNPIALRGPEKEILAQFFADISAAARYVYQSGEGERLLVFIGHNLVGFDLRFLWQRAVINRVKMPSSLLKACKARPWDAVVADTMQMWHPDRDRRISLEKLCKALGVATPKTDLDGSKVYEAYKAGELDRIAEYCGGDVVAMRECYKRLTFA